MGVCQSLSLWFTDSELEDRLMFCTSSACSSKSCSKSRCRCSASTFISATLASDSRLLFNFSVMELLRTLPVISSGAKDESSMISSISTTAQAPSAVSSPRTISGVGCVFFFDLSRFSKFSAFELVGEEADMMAVSVFEAVMVGQLWWGDQSIAQIDPMIKLIVDHNSIPIFLKL